MECHIGEIFPSALLLILTNAASVQQQAGSEVFIFFNDCSGLRLGFSSTSVSDQVSYLHLQCYRSLGAVKTQSH